MAKASQAVRGAADSDKVSRPAGDGESGTAVRDQSLPNRGQTTDAAGTVGDPVLVSPGGGGDAPVATSSKPGAPGESEGAIRTLAPVQGDFSRPAIQLEIVQTGWRPWKTKFKRHHYLSDAGPMGFSTAYTGFVEDEAVCFIGISGMVVGKGRREARVCRMVTVPEWQGAGVGMAFLEWVCERELRGEGFIGKPTTTIMHSAHPALVISLLRNPKWRAIKGSQRLVGGKGGNTVGMGGHMRAVAGFRYYGQAGIEAYDRARY